MLKLIDPAEKLLFTVISRLVKEPLVMTRPSRVAFPKVTSRLPTLGIATDAVPRIEKLLLAGTYLKFRFFVVIARLPILRFELTVISRLVRLPLVTTRPLLVELPKVTLKLPTDGTLTDELPFIAKNFVDES